MNWENENEDEVIEFIMVELERIMIDKLIQYILLDQLVMKDH